MKKIVFIPADDWNAFLMRTGGNMPDAEIVVYDRVERIRKEDWDKLWS